MRFSPARPHDRAACHPLRVAASDDSGAEGISRSRIEGISDGVIAVAITLLVLGVEAPIPEPGESLWNALDSGTLNSLALFVLSFAVIARFWMVHHGVLRDLPERVPAGIVVLNFAFLMMVCLIPFSTTLFDRNPQDMLALVLYAATFAFVSLLTALIGLGASGHLTLRQLAVPVVFLLAIPIGLVFGPTYAPCAWALLFLFASDRIDDTLARRVR